MGCRVKVVISQVIDSFSPWQSGLCPDLGGLCAAQHLITPALYAFVAGKTCPSVAQGFLPSLINCLNIQSAIQCLLLSFFDPSVEYEILKAE